MVTHGANHHIGAAENGWSLAGIFTLCKTTEWKTSRTWTTPNIFASLCFIAVIASKASILEGYCSFLPLLASNPLTSWTWTFTLICCTWPKGSDGLTGSKPRPDKTVPLFFQPSEAYRSSRTYIFSLAVRLCCTWMRVTAVSRPKKDRKYKKG